MSYFTPAFISFFSELACHNTSDWFNDHRKTYEQEVKMPFTAFTEEMINRIIAYEPEVQIKPADAISRINRDVRFSKDKSPYNTHLSANISRFGKKDKGYPGFYYKLGAGGIEVFGGVYMPGKEQLIKIREHIASNSAELDSILRDAMFKRLYGTIQGEVQKRLSTPFKELTADQPLIAHKQLYYTARPDASLIFRADLPERLMEYYLAGKPFNDFLCKAIE